MQPLDSTTEPSDGIYDFGRVQVQGGRIWCRRCPDQFFATLRLAFDHVQETHPIKF